MVYIRVQLSKRLGEPRADHYVSTEEKFTARHDVTTLVPPLEFMVVESNVLGSCSLLKSIACQKVNLTPLKSGMFGPVIFISQQSPGVFCLGLTNHSLSPSPGDIPEGFLSRDIGLQS
jgi:hypothetical protein